MSITDWVIIAASSISTLVLLIYYFYFFLNASKEQEQTAVTLRPVSVIIAARNERKNLQKNLKSILEQDYPDFEVVVVNDGSFDGSSDLLKGFAQQYTRLKLVDLQIEEQYRKGKKFALTMGIKAAQHQDLLFTDADCKPASRHWIKLMMQAKGNKEIVLGVAPLRHKTSWWAGMSYYETFHTALQFIGYSRKKLSYMGLGRNMGYNKELFFQNKGFASHQHLMSGDDDLFIQEVASKDNVALSLHSDSFMWSKAPKNFAAYIKQKTRHLSTSKLYLPKYKRLLGLYSIAQIFWLILLILSLAMPHLWPIVLPILGIKLLLQWLLMIRPAMRLSHPLVAYFLPFFDIMYSLYLLLFGIIKPIAKPKQWN